MPAKRTKQGADTKDICPCAMGGKDQQPAAFSPRTNLFYVGTNNMCMNYEGVEVKYIAGAPYVGANVLMFPGRGGHLGRVHGLGSGDRQEGLGHQGIAVPGVERRPGRPPATSSSTVRWMGGSRP